MESQDGSPECSRSQSADKSSIVCSHDELKSMLLKAKNSKDQHPVKPMPLGAYPSPVFASWGSGPVSHYDEVYPGITLGDSHLAKDVKGLVGHKVTHVLNTAQGTKFSQVNTDASFYETANIKFLGINAMDISGFKLSDYFTETSDFIDECLRSNGRVYVHCFQGISRSASVVIAYLMTKKAMHLKEAALTVRKSRAILPNDGFLKQLCKLNNDLYA